MRFGRWLHMPSVGMLWPPHAYAQTGETRGACGHMGGFA